MVCVVYHAVCSLIYNSCQSISGENLPGSREITAAYVVLPHSYLYCSGHHCHSPGQWSEGGVCVW